MNNTDIKQLRLFFLKLALPLILGGVIALRHHWDWYLYWAIFLFVFLALALLFPKQFSPLRKILNILGHWIGIVISVLLLFVVYFLVLTPTAFLAKLVGKLFLDLKSDDSLTSYWKPRTLSNSKKSDLERQF